MFGSTQLLNSLLNFVSFTHANQIRGQLKGSIHKNHNNPSYKSITSSDADLAGPLFTQTLFTMLFSVHRNCTNALENTDDSLIAKLNLSIICCNEPVP